MLLRWDDLDGLEVFLIKTFLLRIWHIGSAAEVFECWKERYGRIDLLGWTFLLAAPCALDDTGWHVVRLFRFLNKVNSELELGFHVKVTNDKTVHT